MKILYPTDLYIQKKLLNKDPHITAVVEQLKKDREVMRIVGEHQVLIEHTEIHLQASVGELMRYKGQLS